MAGNEPIRTIEINGVKFKEWDGESTVPGFTFNSYEEAEDYTKGIYWIKK